MTEEATPGRAIPIGDVLAEWEKQSLRRRVPLLIVVGGVDKYDHGRMNVRKLKDQSTEPVPGIVRLSAALARNLDIPFDGICDYRLRIEDFDELDLVLVGAGDTNLLSRQVLTSVEGLEDLKVKFEAPWSSQTMSYGVVSTDKPEFGLLTCIRGPMHRVRFAVVCAGNTAFGTNAALTQLTDFIREHKDVPDAKWTRHSEFAVRQFPDGSVQLVWPNHVDANSEKGLKAPLQQIFSGNVHMGDQYTVGQAGAVGPNSKAEGMSFQQLWIQSQSEFDLSVIAKELSTLRGALKREAVRPEHDIVVGEVAAAEEAAQNQDGPAVLSHLKAAGKWALDIATKIGTSVAAKALEKAMGF